jgi:hypothetical protein
MPTATIKLFLPHADAKRFRIAEVSNWTGKALAGPRTDLVEFLGREELDNAGVYFLFGVDPSTDSPVAYIGEAGVVRDRLRSHKRNDFWISIVVFVSKDENLTKAHVKFLESRLMQEARLVGRYNLQNSNRSIPKLPESDREDMEVFLDRIKQVLPVLGSDILTPVTGGAPREEKSSRLYCRTNGAEATGSRTANGFVIFRGSTAVTKERPSAPTQYPAIVELRKKLVANGTLVVDGDYFRFTKDTEFSSPSSAAAVVQGGVAPGPIAWRDEKGTTLKELEEGSLTSGQFRKPASVRGRKVSER